MFTKTCVTGNNLVLHQALLHNLWFFFFCCTLVMFWSFAIALIVFLPPTASNMQSNCQKMSTSFDFLKFLYMQFFFFQLHIYIIFFDLYLISWPCDKWPELMTGELLTMGYPNICHILTVGWVISYRVVTGWITINCHQKLLKLPPSGNNYICTFLDHGLNTLVTGSQPKYIIAWPVDQIIEHFHCNLLSISILM